MAKFCSGNPQAGGGGRAVSPPPGEGGAAPSGVVTWRKYFLEKCVRDDYEQVTFVGKGRYGEVTLARDKITGEEVALKRVMLKHETEGFPITAIRCVC